MMYEIYENVFATACPTSLSNAVPGQPSAQPHQKNILNSWDPTHSKIIIMYFNLINADLVFKNEAKKKISLHARQFRCDSEK